MGIFTFGSFKKEVDLQSSAFFATRPPVRVRESEALKVPAVKACVELISNSISQLPIYLYVENEDNSVERIKDYRELLLNDEPNKYSTGQMVKHQIVQDYLLRGKAYIYKDGNGNLFALEASKMDEENYTVDNVTIAKKIFKYHGLSDVELDENQVIVIDSNTNGLLTDSGELFDTALQQLNYSNNVLKNGSLPLGVLKSATRLTEKAISRLRESWENLYGGPSKAGKTIILEEGLDYKPLGLNPNELQLNETNKAMVSEICRVFNVPESMINSNANKYASNEANQIQFLQNCLVPIITAIESSLNKNLLDRSEKQNGFYFRFDTSELIRATEVEKITAISKGLKDGIYSFNEARSKLDLPKADEDYFVLSLGNVLRNLKGELTILNLGQKLSKQDGGEKQQNEQNKDGTENK